MPAVQRQTVKPISQVGGLSELCENTVKRRGKLKLKMCYITIVNSLYLICNKNFKRLER